MKSLKGLFIIRLAILLTVAFSLTTITGPITRLGNLPRIPLTAQNAVPLTPAPTEKWYPAGTAMDAQQIPIFGSCASELNSIGQPIPGIDLTDCSAPTTLPLQLPNLYFTSPIVTHGYYEIEFLLTNNYWGIDMQFGNNPNGVQLRQGVAHLINKSAFTSLQGDIKGLAQAVDSPVPYGSSFNVGPTKFTFVNPNSCNWDLNFTETGAVCTQLGGPPAGVAYNCAAPGTVTICPVGTLTGTLNYPWQPQIGSPDFCAAAEHFITAFRHAGFGTLQANANCVLQPPIGSASFPPQITSNPVQVFARVDHNARLELGTSLAQELCGIWTGALTSGCNFPGTALPAVTILSGTALSTCILPTSTTGINNCWWIYTAGFDGVYPIDSSLYFMYNSKFVSGIPAIKPPNGPCSSESVPTAVAADYMYLCNPTYDADSSKIEFASSVANAFTSATVAADDFGKGAYTMPIWTDLRQNAYLQNWQRVINGDGVGIPNYFTWLDAYSPGPALAGTVRQGFFETTRSLSPYIATTTHDLYILHNIYDSPLIENPANNGQLLDWMTTSHSFLTNSQLGYPQCALPPATPIEPCYPATATQNLRLNLRNDIFFQDGRQMTGFDVKFAYATLDANGAFAGENLGPMTCARDSTGAALFNCSEGITVKSKNVVDIHLDNFGPFTTIGVGTTFVFPGRYWSASCAGSTWDADTSMGNVPDTCMTLDPSKGGFTYDPIANHILVGSGPWMCADVLGGTGAAGFGCSDTGTQNPPVNHSYTLTRFGRGQAPASSAEGQYFRSSGSLALLIWAGDIGDTAQDTITASSIQACNTPNQPPPTLGQTSGCGHWQQGIGQPGGLGLVTQTQVNIDQRFLFVNWISPFTWAAPPCNGPGSCTGVVNLPDGMAPLKGATLYEGPNTLLSASTIRNGSPVGCLTAYNPTAPTTTGGYDC